MITYKLYQNSPRYPNMREKTKESTVWNIPPIRHTAVSGIFMLISCVYIVFILYLSCATPLSPAMHAQLRHKITFRLYMIYLPDHSRIYHNCTNPLQPIYLVPCMCLSCVTLLTTKHTALLSLYFTPPDTPHPLRPLPPPCLTNLFPKYRKYPRCIVRPHRPTDDSSSNTHNSPHTFHIYIVPIICFSCVYIVSLHTAAYTSPEPIRRR